MSSPRLPLFDDLMDGSNGHSLVARARSARTHNKKEHAVNRLLAKIESLRDRIERETRRLDQALVFHAEHVRPKLDRVTALRKELTRALAPFLDDVRLKGGDRKTLQSVLIAQLDEILAHEPTLERDLEDLFARLHGVGLSEALQVELDGARASMEAMLDELGLDMDVPQFRPGMRDEEVAALAAEIADRMRQQQEERQGARLGRPRNRRKTKRELREEARASRMEQMRKVGIGAVYRRLAKALHPDLEQDPGMRARKSDVMQEVTAAYARNDLHTLLRLEGEWLDGVGGAGAPAAETLDAYTQHLKEQAAALEAEYMMLPFGPRYHALVTDGPLGLPLVLDVRQEAARLDLLMAGITASLARMAAGRALQEARGIARDCRKAARDRATAGVAFV